MAAKRNESAVELAKREYKRLQDSELEGVKRDKDGFLVLEPAADLIDTRSESLTSSIESLEEKLRRYKAEKTRYDDMKKTPEYKEETSRKKKKKKAKKERQNLLEMLFNNNDEIQATITEEINSDNSSDEDEYKDSRKTKRAAAKAAKKTNTLETTYGTRYAPIVSTYYDMIGEFDDTIEDIRKELDTRQGQTRGVYRSAQTGNLISAMNAKFSVAKQIESVANKVSDMEYKKSKDQKSDESDSTRAITFLGAQYLRGSYKGDIGPSKKKKISEPPKKVEKAKKEKKDYVDDDEDDSVKTIHMRDGGPTKTDRENAAEFAKMLLGHRNDIKLNPHEYHIDMEGKYKFVVVADEKHPDDDWEFVAVDPKTDKKIKGFKEEYKDLYPKKKSCRMVFDMGKMRAIDKVSNKSYPLLLK